MAQGNLTQAELLQRSDDASSREELERSSWFAVVRTYLECSRRFGRLLREFDLTVTQYDVLATVSHLGDRAMPHAIADSLFVTRANITGVLKRLEKEKLVTTHKHPDDGRSSICCLTSTGKQRLESAQQAASLFIREQTAATSDSELEFTRSIMRQVEAQLRRMNPEAIANEARGQ